VYARLVHNLSGNDSIANAASEVFVDFLVRIGDESASMAESDFLQPRHDAFLRLLCDRAVVRMTGQSPETYAPIEDLLFGFSLVLQTLAWWIWWGRRGVS